MKIFGNRYTTAALIGGGLVGAYDIASNQSQPKSFGRVASDVAAGAMAGAAATRLGNLGMNYLKQFELGGIKTTANRTIKEGPQKLMNAGRAVLQDVQHPGVVANVVAGSVGSVAMDVLGGEKDVGKIARTAVVGGVVGAAGYSAQRRLLSKHSKGVAESFETKRFLEAAGSAPVITAVGTSMAIGAAEGFTNAALGRQDDNLFGGMAMGALGGAQDVILAGALLAGSRKLYQKGVLKDSLKSFDDALETINNPAQTVASLTNTLKQAADPQARQAASQMLKDAIQSAKTPKSKPRPQAPTPPKASDPAPTPPKPAPKPTPAPEKPAPQKKVEQAPAAIADAIQSLDDAAKIRPKKPSPTTSIPTETVRKSEEDLKHQVKKTDAMGEEITRQIKDTEAQIQAAKAKANSTTSIPIKPAPAPAPNKPADLAAARKPTPPAPPQAGTMPTKPASKVEATPTPAPSFQTAPDPVKPASPAANRKPVRVEFTDIHPPEEIERRQAMQAMLDNDLVGREAQFKEALKQVREIEKKHPHLRGKSMHHSTDMQRIVYDDGSDELVRSGSKKGQEAWDYLDSLKPKPKLPELREGSIFKDYDEFMKAASESREKISRFERGTTGQSEVMEMFQRSQSIARSRGEDTSRYDVEIERILNDRKRSAENLVQEKKNLEDILKNGPAD